MVRITFITSVVLLLISSATIANVYHVAKTGDDSYDGSAKKPFKTIGTAVIAAHAGDTITIHAGIYREWINPLRGGKSELERIVYMAAKGEKVELKGSEVVKNWDKVAKGIWKIILPNSFFGDYNPFKDLVAGDWFIDKGRVHHTGEVFLNGRSLYEKESLEKLANPQDDAKGSDLQDSSYGWYCDSNEGTTTIWANFHQANPNRELVEITTRRTVFYPEKPGINYITLKGFHISQAATQWAAPTAEQVGIVATHWNKGWVIEDNVISDSKCNGITLGKDKSTGDNVWSKDQGNVNRDGNIHYLEVIFNVMRNRWTKSEVGSHVVRNNRIFNCEQTGICGSMGAVFSTIENNHIYDIWKKRQFAGWEIGGIKFHAPIDVLIKDNNIHDSGRGIWLDWMTQGTRVSGNLFYRNDQQDLYIEVNHGPYLVDNNILLSPTSISNQSEGGAYVHNLIAGLVAVKNDLNRFTPYFLPHSLDMAGITTIFGGDDRFYNNIFIADVNSTEHHGLKGYNETKLPTWAKGNIYFNGAKPSLRDENFKVSPSDPLLRLIEDKKGTFLELTLDSTFLNHQVELIDTEVLGRSKIAKARFENTDGTDLTIDTDYLGKNRIGPSMNAGPFATTKNEQSIIKLWPHKNQ